MLISSDVLDNPYSEMNLGLGKGPVHSKKYHFANLEFSKLPGYH